MSKRGYISRYLLILKKLQIKPYTSYGELMDYIAHQTDLLQMKDDTLDIGFSKRTLLRDMRDIRNIFGIDIEYSTNRKGYYIAQNEMENMNFQRRMEAFDMFNSLNFAQDLMPFIHLEKRKPQGTNNLHGILHAIRNKLEIKFSYQKFWEVDITFRTAHPMALKEFKNRWYVLAKDNKDNKLKHFALDRLSNFDITKRTFESPASDNIKEFYRYCFGIITPTDGEPEEIILSFNPVQGKYIKTLPLHDTQQILIDNQNEFRISLSLFVTHDLIMELLSFGPNLKVLQPISLMTTIRDRHKKAFEQYGLENDRSV
jgi:predicted DNA-binding transcriptional regulator YafY